MFKDKKTAQNLDIQMPAHIGIIMDGNGRWAKKRGLPRSSGHTIGAATFKKITRYAAKIGVKHLTMYAFSTENWVRPEIEIKALLKLFKQYLEEALRDFLDENIKVNFLGDVTKFPKELQDLIHDVEKVSENRTGMVLNLAMNYGGRDEILMSVNTVMQRMKSGDIPTGDITAEMLSENLYTGTQPDPDLIIRPSGEQRLSNFMIWQSAYAEFVFSDILWPDFKPRDLDKAIEIYSGRQRRFGGVK